MGKGLEYLGLLGVTQVSPLGERAAELLEQFFSGMHNADLATLRRVDWANTYFIEYRLFGQLSSFDFDNLTRLVLLAHDHCLRVSIGSLSSKHLCLLIHARARTGSIDQRHPTIEGALELWRRYHPIEATYGYQPGTEAVPREAANVE